MNSVFLYLPLTIPHIKFQVPDWSEYSDKNWTTEQKIQAAMITRMDRDVGRLLSLLQDEGVDQDTLVIFSSDNGAHGFANTIEQFNSSGGLRGKKRDLYEGGIRVPMVARWPGKIEAGSESNHISGFQDILPTFAEIANVSIPKDVNGISMVSTLFGSGMQRQHDHLYWEFYEKGGKQAVLKGKWKAVRVKVGYNFSGEIELYDLLVDEQEQNDVSSEYPDVVAQMEKIMREEHIPHKEYNYGSWDKEYVNFENIELKPFLYQDIFVKQMRKDKLSLYLEGNSWKYIEHPYEVTKNTYLEFEFYSDSEGDGHGIAFCEEVAFPAQQDKRAQIKLCRAVKRNMFLIRGFQKFKHSEHKYKSYVEGEAFYRIRLSDYFEVGTQLKHIVFVNDHDVKEPLANSLFKRFRLLELENVEEKGLRSSN